MSVVSSLRIEAENFAYSAIDELRIRILGLIGNAGSLSGWQGTALRDSVRIAIEDFVKQSTRDGGTYLNQAWTAGEQRASTEFSKQLKNLPGASIASEVSTGLEILRSANNHVAAGLEKSIQTLLSRASVRRDLTVDELLSSLRDRSASGVFDSAKKQMAASLSEEVTQMESRAHDLRGIELQKHVELQKRSGTMNKEVRGKMLMPVTIRVWRHKPLDMVANPRPGHVALDGMGVVFDPAHKDIPFFVDGADGILYKTLGPKQPPLPIGETIHCGCTVEHKVIWVTAEQRDVLIKESERSGGFADSRWSRTRR